MLNLSDRELQLPASHRPQPGENETSRWIAETVPRSLAYAITLVRSRHDAEDIVQDCYRRLLSRAEHYDLPRDGAKLLYKSITNACVNHVQRRSTDVSLETVGEQSRPPQGSKSERPDARLLHRELEDAVAQALAELPVNQRAVVELSCFGHPLVDVAEMLELSDSNTRVLLFRARQTLAARLREFREEQTK